MSWQQPGGHNANEPSFISDQGGAHQQQGGHGFGGKESAQEAVKTTTAELTITASTSAAAAPEGDIAKKGQQVFARDPRPHLNIVLCGHVDAGKSTISGHLLADFGLVNQHTYKTGTGYFETTERRVMVHNVPSNRAFVPSMISCATQADICVLVISSRTGEFETGFEKGGQTREHAMLVRTCGVKQMICVINKMDDNGWDQVRYDEIVGKLRPFLKSNGFDEKTGNLIFVPVAGLSGKNLLDKAPECTWYKGPTVMEFVNTLVLPESKSEDDQLAIPLVGSYKDDGKVFIYGKVESGSAVVGDKIQILPTKVECTVEAITIETTEFQKCYPGDNVHLRVRGIDENDIHAGYVATGVAGETNLKPVEFFLARIVVLEVKNIICAGSKVMMHIHAAQEEVSIHKILAKLDRKTNEVIEKEPTHAKAGDVIMARVELERSVVVETHKDFDKLGRFMLREDGKTIAIGLITKLYESTKENIMRKL